MYDFTIVYFNNRVASDGTEFVKSWVLNWDKVAQAKWFALPNSCQ